MSVIDFSKPYIIFEDEFLFVLYKPSNYYVHAPESKFAKQTVEDDTCIDWINENLNIKADPIHRLDYATEGLVIFGKSTDTTQKLNMMMRDRQISKYYEAITRGWFKEPYGKIEIPLENHNKTELNACTTLYSTKATLEINEAINPKFKTSRYTWLDIELQTGRWHQIRRHMNRLNHPIIGDVEHGDHRHNHFFRDKLGLPGLCLKANRLRFVHPMKNIVLEIKCPVSPKWDLISKIFFTSEAKPNTQQ